MHVSAFKYFLPILHSLLVHRSSAEGTNTFLKALWFLLLSQNLVKLTLTRS